MIRKKAIISGKIKRIWFACFCFVIYFNAQAQITPQYSFYVAGHAYGAHAGTNLGLHPPFLKKLKENKDSTLMGLFLTGDIVNYSTTASWNQVDRELSELGINSFFVMGNHDNNTIGKQVFINKHGGLYYYFVYSNELYIVLNSTESDRSISKTQLEFLDNIFANTDANWERAFIFFHEVIWNSNEKYKQVRSNSRSRYSQLVNISNFWTDVYPRLAALPEKKFYLFSGDVGGNPDAIPAFYDRWENVTLLSSGMGEVADENFMKVNVFSDTVTFQLIPLNDAVELKPVTWYSVPVKPDTIYGPEIISTSQNEAVYRIPAIDNATGYKWQLSKGISGNSDSSQIMVHFDVDFQSGKISVIAVNDGFGESSAVELGVIKDNATFVSENLVGEKFKVYQSQKLIHLDFDSYRNQLAEVRIYNSSGLILYDEKFNVCQSSNSRVIPKKPDFKGLAVVQLLLGDKKMTSKIILF